MRMNRVRNGNLIKLQSIFSQRTLALNRQETKWKGIMMNSKYVSESGQVGSRFKELPTISTKSHSDCPAITPYGSCTAWWHIKPQSQKWTDKPQPLSPAIWLALVLLPYWIVNEFLLCLYKRWGLSKEHTNTFGSWDTMDAFGIVEFIIHTDLITYAAPDDFHCTS